MTGEYWIIVHPSIALQSYLICFYYCCSFCDPGKYFVGIFFSGIIFLSPKSTTTWCHCCHINNCDISLSKNKNLDKHIGHGSSSFSQNNYRLLPSWIVLILWFCNWPVSTIFSALVLPCRLTTSKPSSFNRFESGSVNYLRASSSVMVPPIFRTSSSFLSVSAYSLNL